MKLRAAVCKLRSAVCTLAIFCGAAPAAGQEEALHFNPFAIPDLGGVASAERESAPVAGSWEPVLRATLVADRGSLADLGGVLLEVGESYRGWQLREVREFEAVFERQGEQVLLTVNARSERGDP